MVQRSQSERLRDGVQRGRLGKRGFPSKTSTMLKISGYVVSPVLEILVSRTRTEQRSPLRKGWRSLFERDRVRSMRTSVLRNK